MRATLTPIVVVLAFMLLFPAVLISSLVNASGNWIHRLGRLWAGTIIRTSGIKIEVQGHGHIPVGKPVIFACNHASQFDIPLLLEDLPLQFRFVVKKELFKIPLFGFALHHGGYIPIDRSGGKAALRSLQKAAERVKKGTSIVIFPEGTRSPDGRLMPFKVGGILIAIKAGCPIVPVAISGSHKVLPKGSIRVRPGLIKMTFGLPVQTVGPEGPIPRDIVKKEVWDSISAMLEEKP
ncbi:MAG: 1-acyl-sn-glycerol-3-phosphate acyltransferase [Deltaproteobacteria bacterium]|nr:1-acyl-sn-glycerol-3-phosphate acyltransferase [Deltaproteobacteria bacterium]MBW1718768.1 1-acyl-sn-glycerol-3-phosphate acyltransferase [Deltaproteobacteria bacterium]MBW1932706.1 1-acyl-sn-glycerol-3-phosphate acyltransferase [Deltaproteobacteria bacterium]MBW1937891.1 1-acyl-sn-glycerol-3-phosphate acyltransferase [Deltaproteobacteria bacterium]MBW1963892.1 1-acyl-sn-glycerol-3-phosphate acyltransferase [Deltaproteobacteria bacterium]